MFRKLCGDDALKNVVIVTNMWGNVDPHTGDEREARLKGSDIFFKPVLTEGAQMARHDNTVSSAERIVRLILNHHPVPLRIQEELVDERKDITKTSAGVELDREKQEQIEKYKREMEETMKEMQEAMWGENEKLKRELQDQTQLMEVEVKRVQKDRDRLASEYKEEKKRLVARVQQVEMEMTMGMERQQRQIEGLMDNFFSVQNAASHQSKKARKPSKTDKAGAGFFSRLRNQLVEPRSKVNS